VILVLEKIVLLTKIASSEIPLAARALSLITFACFTYGSRSLERARAVLHRPKELT
jgi:hypothetical protein